MQMIWLSAHLFYTGDLHVLLRRRVISFLNETGYPAFFIRYGEGGPHIRLRCQITALDVSATQALLLAMEQSFEGLNIRFVAYEPEINRYGNVQSIGWAERQFISSSRYVLEVLSVTPEWNNSVALLQALRMNIAIAWALDTGEIEMTAICDQFIKSWMSRLYDRTKPVAEQEAYSLDLMETRFDSYANALLPAAISLWEGLENGDAPASLQMFAQENRHVFREYIQLGFDRGKMRDIIGSFMHMGHNRLGVSNLDEAYIMFFTLKCLQHVYARR